MTPDPAHEGVAQREFSTVCTALDVLKTRHCATATLLAPTHLAERDMTGTARKQAAARVAGRPDSDTVVVLVRGDDLAPAAIVADRLAAIAHGHFGLVTGH